MNKDFPTTATLAKDSCHLIINERTEAVLIDNVIKTQNHAVGPFLVGIGFTENEGGHVSISVKGWAWKHPVTKETYPWHGMHKGHAIASWEAAVRWLKKHQTIASCMAYLRS